MLLMFLREIYFFTYAGSKDHKVILLAVSVAIGGGSKRIPGIERNRLSLLLGMFQIANIKLIIIRKLLSFSL